MEEKVEKNEQITKVSVEEAWKIVRSQLFESTLKIESDSVPESLGVPLSTREQEEAFNEKMKKHLKTSNNCNTYSEVYGKVAIECDSLAEYVTFLHMILKKAKQEMDPMEMLARMLGGK